MGFALAAAARDAGWEVDLVHGPVALAVPDGVQAHPVVTGEEMYAACARLFPHCDLLLMCAAVCDIRPVTRAHGKVKKEDIGLTVAFERTRDILKTLSASKRPGQVLVGFAAETESVEAYARRKLEEKDLDWIVANSVAAGGAFEAHDNTVCLIPRSGRSQHYGPAPKAEVARWIVFNVKNGG